VDWIVIPALAFVPVVNVWTCEVESLIVSAVVVVRLSSLGLLSEPRSVLALLANARPTAPNPPLAFDVCECTPPASVVPPWVCPVFVTPCACDGISGIES